MLAASNHANATALRSKEPVCAVDYGWQDNQVQLCQVPAASRAAAPCFPRWPWRLWSRLQRWLPRRFQGWIPRWQVGLHQSLINHLLNLRCKKQCKRHVVSDAMHVQVPRDADYAETFITCKSLTHGFFHIFVVPTRLYPPLKSNRSPEALGLLTTDSTGTY